MSTPNSPRYAFPAPAKLNLFLHITGQRANGYHDLQTVFQFLNYSDTLYFTPNNSNVINLLTQFPDVKAQDNLIVKAAISLQQAAANKGFTGLGVDIEIEKILPMGGGLGGGSSNAATVLVALNRLWNLPFSTKELAQIGLYLGADVPIFVEGYAAFAEGVGEKLTAVEPKEYWYLVTKPEISIATASVFSAPDLPRNTPKIQLTDWNINTCHNDCETWVIKHHPEVAKLLAWLVEYAPSRMTGTGACIFSRFETEYDAIAVKNKLPSGTFAFIAQGANTSPLRQAITDLPVNNVVT
ncbi:MAG: 4-(cytidine 5'-diphospho)-2-C-methyl-D-erythritol kinase [Thalassotalea sp.]